ncbi:MAG TPA: S8 family serine peptidase [Bryobacteraceae bacterium]|jgi:minor extracellular serine protease Vpr|nr:S8 family serine peptidase [Bryobacteraceae bacterium]
MRRSVRAFIGFLFWASEAFAQQVPGHYVVELSGAPLGAEVRTKGRDGLRDRVAAIRSEQARVRALIEQRNGKMLSSLDSLMNALIVKIGDVDASALPALPGVKRVYPVYQYKMDLDHALPIHHVPEAWALIGGKDKAGAGVRIAILDTGVSPNHPAFHDPTLKPPPGFPQASKPENLAFTNNKIIVARSYEDIYQETDPDDAQDRMGHGTETAMCAAGVTNTGPYATITGVAPKAWIGGYKIIPGNSGNASGDVILKAMDDALADGMDVINLSFGAPGAFPEGPDYLPAVAVDRLRQFGMVMVVSAGNSGPNLNTMGDFASQASVISVGAVQSDRAFNGSVFIAGAAPVQAFSSSGPVPGPMTTTVFDVSSVDPTGLLCSAPLPAGSASGQIALIMRGTCTFEQKVNNAAAGGAVAAIIYVQPSQTPIHPSIGAATLPTVLLGNSDGVALMAAVDTTPSTTVTVTFDGIAYPEDPRVLASFTSRGPNYDYSIKPDLVAVGTDVYMATQSLDPTGQLYSQSGYIVANGTSFSSPLTAGAVAVLRGARPGLTVDQYRSLIINSATPITRPDGQIERVQQAGVGVLTLDAALQSTIAAYPTSLTYLLGNGTLGGATTGDVDQLTLTNVGKTADVFHISTIPFDTAPGLQFSTVSSDDNPTSTLDLPINPGQSKTIYAYWTTDTPLAIGEYQGDILVEGAKGDALVPYWYGVPSGAPQSVTFMNSLPTSAAAGTTVDLFVRVTDLIGYAITDNPHLGFQSQVSAGGGAIALSPAVYFPNVRLIALRLGPKPVDNTYTFSFGSVAPIQVTITGTTSN